MFIRSLVLAVNQLGMVHGLSCAQENQDYPNIGVRNKRRGIVESTPLYQDRWPDFKAHINEKSSRDYQKYNMKNDNKSLRVVSVLRVLVRNGHNIEIKEETNEPSSI